MLHTTEMDRVAPALAAGRWLTFSLAGLCCALPVSAVSGLAPNRPLLRVPGAPSEILGLAEWRGALYTVVDLPRWLDLETASGPGCLVLLAPPLQQTALHVPAVIGLAAPRSATGDGWPGPPPRRIDPVALVREVEARIREVASAARGSLGASAPAR